MKHKLKWVIVIKGINILIHKKMASGLSALLTLVTDNILSGGRRTTAARLRSVLNEVLSSYLNVSDGGNTVQNLSGYTTELTPTDNKHFTPKKYVDDKITALIDGAPASLDTLNELAAALADDANFSATVIALIGTKANKVGDTFTGAVKTAEASMAASDIDWSTKNDFYKTIGANLTVTFSNVPAAGTSQTINVTIKQDGTGNWTVTWPGTIVWRAGAAPTQTVTLNKADIYTFKVVNGIIYGAQSADY